MFSSSETFERPKRYCFRALGYQFSSQFFVIFSRLWSLFSYRWSLIDVRNFISYVVFQGVKMWLFRDLLNLIIIYLAVILPNVDVISLVSVSSILERFDLANWSDEWQAKFVTYNYMSNYLAVLKKLGWTTSEVKLSQWIEGSEKFSLNTGSC